MRVNGIGSTTEKYAAVTFVLFSRTIWQATLNVLFLKAMRDDGPVAAFAHLPRWCKVPSCLLLS